jgi:hypothetical protein
LASPDCWQAEQQQQQQQEQQEQQEQQQMSLGITATPLSVSGQERGNAAADALVARIGTITCTAALFVKAAVGVANSSTVAVEPQQQDTHQRLVGNNKTRINALSATASAWHH